MTHCHSGLRALRPETLGLIPVGSGAPGSAPAEALQLTDDGVCVITPPGADIRWSPRDPDVLREALAALRQLA
jgi:hypothetical protein